MLNMRTTALVTLIAAAFIMCPSATADTPKALECAALDGIWTPPETCTLTGPLSGTIEINFSSFVLDCDGHQLSSAVFADTVVLPEGSSNVTIKNCRIDANGGAGIFSNSNGNRFLNNVIYGGWAGIFMSWSFGTTISGNAISDSSTCVYVGKGSHNTFSSNDFACDFGSWVFYENNDRFESNIFSGSSGASLWVRCDADQLLIDDNTFEGAGVSVQGGCNVPAGEGGSRGPRNAAITNNDFDGLGVAWSAVFFNAGLINPRIDNNAMTNYVGTGIYFDFENKHIEITNNTISNVGEGISNASGFTFSGTDHYIAGNSIDNASGRAITLLGDSNVDIVDNLITNSGGVLIANTHNTRFTDNIILDGVASSSTLLSTGDGCRYQMVIDVNSDSGVTVLGATDALVADNDIDTVAGDGVRVQPMKRARINVPPEWMNANPPPPGGPRPPPPETAGCFWSPAPYQMPPYLDIDDIQVLASDNVSVVGNTINGAGLDGISFRETDHGEISNNVVSNSSDDGTGLEDSSFNDVTGNTYNGCGGVSIEESGTSTGNNIAGNVDNCRASERSQIKGVRDHLFKFGEAATFSRGPLSARNGRSLHRFFIKSVLYGAPVSILCYELRVNTLGAI